MARLRAGALRHGAALLVTGLLAAWAAPPAQAGWLRDAVQARRQAARASEAAGARADEDAPGPGTPRGPLPPGVRVIEGLAYGPDPAQRLDVYLPANGSGPAQGRSIILMVHGGGWRQGDKAMGRVVDAKLAHWAPAGVVFVSVNYRLLPAAAPLQQAADVARALLYVQQHAERWGGDARRVVLMGHSAGSHLVALVGSSPAVREQAGAPVQPWLGSVLLDSAALDVPAIMRGRHMRLYDEAFGTDPATWRAASPWHQLQAAVPPVLAVCSSRRAQSCEQAGRYVDKATGLGGTARVLPQPLSHGEINARLGQPGAYTDAVDAFLRQIGALPRVQQP